MPIKRGPHKLRRTVNMALEIFFSENVDNFMDWVNALEDPKDKIDVWIKLLPYRIPRLTQVDANVNVRHSLADFSDEELAVIATQPITNALPGIDNPGGPQRPN